MSQHHNGKRLAVFVSGSGSNLQALLDVERTDATWPGKLVLVVSDKPACYAIERAKQAEVRVFAASPKSFADKAAYERAILDALKSADVDWLVLAGYMRLIGPTLLSAYPDRIVNIHPSLLPAFPGAHAVRDALAAKATQTGVTVHLVDEGVDTGPVLEQVAVDINPDMTEEALLERIHHVEHELYPRVVRRLLVRD